MGNTVGPGKSFESAVQRDAGETPMNQNDEQTISKIQSESEPLLVQEIRMRQNEACRAIFFTLKTTSGFIFVLPVDLCDPTLQLTEN